MKKALLLLLLIAVLLPVLDFFSGLWFSRNPRIIIHNQHSGSVSEISVGEPTQTLSQLLTGESQTFHVSGDERARHSIRFRTSRKRLFSWESGPYSGGLGWDLVTITVNKRGQISLVQENWSGSRQLRRPYGYYSPEPYAPLPKLIQDLSSSNYGTRAVAASNISYRPANAALASPALIQAIRNQDDEYWRIFSYTLAKIGAPAVSDIVPLLRDRDAKNRQAAAYALEEMGPPASPAVPDLTRCLRDAKPEVRNECLKALGAIGSEAHDAVPEIISLSKTLHQTDLRIAIDALESIGTTEADRIVDSYWLKDYEDSSKRH